MIISMLTDKLHCWFKAVRAIETTEKCGNGSIGQNRIENLIGEESQYVYGRRRTLAKKYISPSQACMVHECIFFLWFVR